MTLRTFWREMIAKQTVNGFSVQVWCSRQKAPEASFYVWRFSSLWYEGVGVESEKLSMYHELLSLYFWNYLIHRLEEEGSLNMANEKADESSFDEDFSLEWTDDFNMLHDLCEHNASVEAGATEDDLACSPLMNVSDDSGCDADLLVGFTGRDQDAEPELYFHRFRQFDRMIGHWISNDID